MDEETARSNAPWGRVILVVEGSARRLQFVQVILEDAGFLVLSAATASHALELADSCPGPIQLLITTLRPSGMTGPDLTSCLRRRFPDMSVLYTSGNPLATLEVPDPAEVVSSMLPRPFSKEILLRRVNTLLAPHACV
jgi:two-component system, cell cycle sensor histidine kinase and response regulator CckA